LPGGCVLSYNGMKEIFKKIRLYLQMIRFSHSVFALPFAFTAAILAASGFPSFHQILWIAVAMIGARSGAMGLNRIIDRKIDSMNPRTCKREIPSGKISVGAALAFTIISLGVMIYSAYELNPLCLALSPVAILILVIYSYTKRFTWASHIVLGIAITCAPMGAWMAIKGTIGTEIIPLVIAIIFWLAGFDILYALQDIDFDREHGLYSIPRRFGIPVSLMISRIFHALTFGLFLWTGIIFGLNFIYFAGLAVVAALLIYEHALVRPDDLSKLNIAFFNMNGYISITVFIFTYISMIY
jgi:4-hydroxybenzoate polyprenyltransferase